MITKRVFVLRTVVFVRSIHTFTSFFSSLSVISLYLNFILPKSMSARVQIIIVSRSSSVPLPWIVWGYCLHYPGWCAVIDCIALDGMGLLFTLPWMVWSYCLHCHGWCGVIVYIALDSMGLLFTLPWMVWGYCLHCPR